MFTPKGKFGWYELMTSDTKAAGKFYSDVVGWTTQEMPSTDGMPVHHIQSGQRRNGRNVEYPRAHGLDWLHRCR